MSRNVVVETILMSEKGSVGIRCMRRFRVLFRMKPPPTHVTRTSGDLDGPRSTAWQGHQFNTTTLNTLEQMYRYITRPKTRKHAYKNSRHVSGAHITRITYTETRSKKLEAIFISNSRSKRQNATTSLNKREKHHSLSSSHAILLQPLVQRLGNFKLSKQL